MHQKEKMLLNKHCLEGRRCHGRIRIEDGLGVTFPALQGPLGVSQVASCQGNSQNTNKAVGTEGPTFPHLGSTLELSQDLQVLGGKTYSQL